LQFSLAYIKQAITNDLCDHQPSLLSAEGIMSIPSVKVTEASGNTSGNKSYFDNAILQLIDFNPPYLLEVQGGTPRQ